MQVIESLQPLLAELSSGADCVWLAGSYATGDSTPYSDVDLGILANAPRPRRFEVQSGLLISIATTTAAATRASFNMPGSAGAAVPGWRQAVVLFDPDGVGSALQAEARAWSWQDIDLAAARWCWERQARLADDVLKLLGALQRATVVESVFRRNQLAAALPLSVAVAKRLLYGSERNLLPMVELEVGAEAAAHLRAALGGPHLEAEQSCRSALWLYRRVAALLPGEPSAEDRKLVDFALTAIERI